MAKKIKSVDIQIKEIFKKMEQLPIKMQKSIATGATRAAAVVVQKSAKTFIPEETGNLKEGIKIKKRRNKNKLVTTYAIGMDNSPYEFNNGKKSKKSKTTKSFYAFFIHEGTEKKAPNPFFIKAYEATKTQTLQKMKEYFKRRTEALIKKLV